jgi:hypothetical protein
VWPIKLLRFFVSIFFTLFYVSALGVFIVSFDCNVQGAGPRDPSILGTRPPIMGTGASYHGHLIPL